MFQFTQIGAVPGGECFLLTTSEKTALIDTGFAYCVQQTIENLERALQGRNLDFILLTHTHYDHASALPQLKAHWPQTITVASEYGARILKKESTWRVFHEMNVHAAAEAGTTYHETPISSFEVDRIVKDGDQISFGPLTLEVIETPGHTRCSIAFYSKEEHLFLANETFGTLGLGVDDVIPCHLVGHQMTLDSIKKATALDVEHLLIPHYGLVHGKDISVYLATSSANVEKTKDLILQGHKQGLNLEELIDLLKKTYYNETLASYQPEAAFLLNARHMISMILREVLHVSTT